jgi:hypothetical protein
MRGSFTPLGPGGAKALMGPPGSAQPAGGARRVRGCAGAGFAQLARGGRRSRWAGTERPSPRAPQCFRHDHRSAAWTRLRTRGASHARRLPSSNSGVSAWRPRGPQSRVCESARRGRAGFCSSSSAAHRAQPDHGDERIHTRAGVIRLLSEWRPVGDSGQSGSVRARDAPRDPPPYDRVAARASTVSKRFSRGGWR